MDSSPLRRLACYTGVLALGIVATLSATSSIETVVQAFGRDLQSAAAFFTQGITRAEIQKEYRKGEVRILIVPGHQPRSGGTQYGLVHERDLVVEIADALAVHLEGNRRIEVMVSRTKEEWHPTLEAYFATARDEIDAFRAVQSSEMATQVASGRFVLEADQVHHNAAPTEAARQLYGINLWAGENEYPIVLHLHLNDYAGRRGSEGKYAGFAIYVPDEQYSNAKASRSLAEAIAMRLAGSHATSTLPQESGGVVPDRELIATGANNSADSAALLIEYGYIYEPQFVNEELRRAALNDYAYQTYLGLMDFLDRRRSPAK